MSANVQGYVKKCLLLPMLLFSLSSSQAKPYYGHQRDSSREASLLDPFLAAASSNVESQPMQHTDNYNLIMPDYYDQHPAETMPKQNFEKFYDPDMAESADLGMDETAFLQSTPVRAPQPLSAEERRIREKVQLVDLKREKKALLKLKKGSSEPRGEDAHQWEQFDYDLYSVNPGDNKKYIYG